jgi:hypothetical protein
MAAVSRTPDEQQGHAHLTSVKKALALYFLPDDIQVQTAKCIIPLVQWQKQTPALRAHAFKATCSFKSLSLQARDWWAGYSSTSAVQKCNAADAAPAFWGPTRLD